MSSTDQLIKICLIRSGPTEWQADGRVQGTNNLELSTDGLAIASRWANGWTVSPPPKIIYCSSDDASRRTAELFAARIPPAKVKPLEELAEVDMGLWQGLTEDQLGDRYPKAFSQWRQHPDRVAVPQGETLEAAIKRVQPVLRKRSKRAAGPEAPPLLLVLRPILFEAMAAWLQQRPADDPLELTDPDAFLLELAVAPAVIKAAEPLAAAAAPKKASA